MNIEAFAAKKLETEAKLRGVPIVIRALTSMELKRCAEAFVRPRAPMIADPTKGMLAASIPDEQNEVYRNGKAEWNANTAAAQAVLAAGLDMGDPAVAKDAAWLAKAVEKLRHTLAADEIIRIVSVADRLAMLSLSEEDAKKGLSSTSPASPLTGSTEPPTSPSDTAC